MWGGLQPARDFSPAGRRFNQNRNRTDMIAFRDSTCLPVITPQFELVIAPVVQL